MVVAVRSSNDKSKSKIGVRVVAIDHQQSSTNVQQWVPPTIVTKERQWLPWRSSDSCERRGVRTQFEVEKKQY